METLTQLQEMMVNKLIAQEFIEEKLGIDGTPENVSLFIAYIISYEQSINRRLNMKTNLVNAEEQ